MTQVWRGLAWRGSDERTKQRTREGFQLGWSYGVSLALATGGRVASPLVAGRGHHGGKVMAKAEVFLRKWGSFGPGEGQFNGPVGIAVQGNQTFVTDPGNSRVQVLDRNGTFLRTWGSPGTKDSEFNGPAGMAVQGNEVFVTELGNNRVQVFDCNGNFVRKWGFFGPGD